MSRLSLLSVIIILLTSTAWLVFVSLDYNDEYLNGATTESLFHVPSPDEKHVVTVYIWKWGDSIDYETVVSIRPHGETFNANDNGSKVFGVSESTCVYIEWLSADVLQIYYYGRALGREELWGGISIQYQQLGPVSE